MTRIRANFLNYKPRIEVIEVIITTMYLSHLMLWYREDLQVRRSTGEKRTNLYAGVS